MVLFTKTHVPVIPNNNGVVERKNRHLLETTRALMFTQSVPNVYWVEAILTATYLINRLPSNILEFKTPLNVFLEFSLTIPEF